jgi:hypothetical protein
MNNLGELYRAEGQYAKAEALHKRSLAIWDKTLGRDHVDVAASLNNLALLSRYRANTRRPSLYISAHLQSGRNPPDRIIPM